MTLQQLIKSIPLSQNQIAKELNVHKQTITRWVLDQSKPSPQNYLMLHKLCKKYNINISVDELLTM